MQTGPRHRVLARVENACGSDLDRVGALPVARVTVKLGPWLGSEATVSIAPIHWARPWAMASPSPVVPADPAKRSLAVDQNGPNRFRNAGEDVGKSKLAAP